MPTTWDVPFTSYMAFYVISLHLANSNYRSPPAPAPSGSSHWRLDAGEGKVMQVRDEKKAAPAADRDDDDDDDDDAVMEILTNKITENGTWRVETGRRGAADSQCTGCGGTRPPTPPSIDRWFSEKAESKSKKILTCGKPVNSTNYDHLGGIMNRQKHPQMPEPDVAMMFHKKGTKNSEVDLNELEDRLQIARRELKDRFRVHPTDQSGLQTAAKKPKSVQVLNQIGNFWRIKGNTQLSIECFRKALSVSPDNSEVLLNLARVLFNLQYLDDAIHLTQKSLTMQPPELSTWLQHFTLGEILKAYGRDQEASLHFRHTLNLNPGFQPAQAHLREMEGSPGPSVTQYTLFIILFLVLGVLFGVITSIEANFDDCGETVKTQRHFNRAMAMRSIKLGINPRLVRMRKMNC